jgi:hypothetical protein
MPSSAAIPLRIDGCVAPRERHTRPLFRLLIQLINLKFKSKHVIIMTTLRC